MQKGHNTIYFLMAIHMCRYNYTVYQDTEHGRQKIIKDGVDTLISVVDSVGNPFGTLAHVLGGGRGRGGGGVLSVHTIAMSDLM